MNDQAKREENIARANSYEVPVDHPSSLHYKSYLPDLFACLNRYSSGTLLDIGCGNKPYQEVVDHLVNGYIGCDIVQSSEHKADIICEATDIPLRGESFDTVISTQTIEHVAEPQLLVNEAHRLLKQNGYFILSGPLYWPLHEEPYDFFRFTKHGFRFILNKAGFSVVEERANGGKWAMCGQAFIHALWPGLETFKFRRPVIKLIYRIFSRLDEYYPDTTNTMNYVFVSRK